MSYQGFFQSEEWFTGYAQEVRCLFEPLPEHVRMFERYRRREPYVCVHMRRADYLDTNIWALPTSFFLDVLGTVDALERFDVVVVTDDPVFVRRELGDVPRLVCERRPPMTDFQLLLHADVVVTSNSSFSWWGAWLNNGLDTQVIAPKNWLGFAAGVEEPRKVIPAPWTTVAVRDPPLRSRGDSGTRAS